jgi:hypothetical protein
VKTGLPLIAAIRDLSEGTDDAKTGVKITPEVRMGGTTMC